MTAPTTTPPTAAPTDQAPPVFREVGELAADALDAPLTRLTPDGARRAQSDVARLRA